MQCKLNVMFECRFFFGGNKQQLWSTTVQLLQSSPTGSRSFLGVRIRRPPRWPTQETQLRNTVRSCWFSLEMRWVTKLEWLCCLADGCSISSHMNTWFSQQNITQLEWTQETTRLTSRQILGAVLRISGFSWHEIPHVLVFMGMYWWFEIY